MNIQTERLENHTARFTVEVENDQLEAAKQSAAKKIARQVRVPGFRKGKVPYRVLVNYVGEAAILEDAVEELGNKIYPDALDESGVEPYGPGMLEDFQLDPQPVFKFVVPLQPTVELGDYRDIRIDYEAPTIEDEDVEKALKALQEREALIEESTKPVAAGNRVTVSIKGEYLDTEDDDTDGEEAEGEEEAEEEAVTEDVDTVDEAAETSDDEAEDEDDESSVFIDNDQLIFSLTEDEEPAPGFTDALVGAEVGERREFDLTYPDDEEEFSHLAGRHVKFDVTIKKIETVTLPELNDEFAARVSQPANEGDEEEKEPETLLELRMRIRKDLEEEAEERAKAEYADQVLEQVIEQATFAYPDALVSDQVHHILQHLDNDLRQRGLTIDDYMKVTNKTHEDLHVDYHDNAVETIKRSLAVRELTQAEGVEVTDADLDAEIDKIVARFGEQAAAFRSIYDNANMRDNMRSDLLNRKVMDRLVSIARGEAPAVPEPAEAQSQEEQPDEEGDSA